MRRLLLILTALALFTPALVAAPATAHAEDVIAHDAFDALLEEYVDRRGRVAYAKLRADKEDRAALASYVAQVAEADVAKHSKKARLAFYINAYNALVIHAIVEQWPVESVMKVPGFFKKTRHGVAGKKMTLDELENGIIRPKFKDARIHFVLVCGAESCPRLRREALTEESVHGVMGRAAREFINSATRVEGGKVHTSKLFEWFASDFERDEGSVARYLAKYFKGEQRDAIASGELELTFDEYDWAINKR